MASEDTISAVKELLGQALGLGKCGGRLDANSGLLGSVPELDSMAVVSVLALIEEQFDIEISDDDVDAATFESLGTLADFVESKLAA